VDADVKLLFVRVHKKYRAVLQSKIITDDGEDVVQHLIHIKSGEDRLAGVMQYGNLLS